MLLFPGEEALYEEQPGFRVTDSEAGRLLVCSGRCERSLRPLSCRIFPLLPLLRGQKIKVATDARALGTCPLRRDDLSAEFIDGVRQCGQWLAEAPETRDFLLQLTGIHDELKALQRSFRR